MTISAFSSIWAFCSSSLISSSISGSAAEYCTAMASRSWCTVFQLRLVTKNAATTVPITAQNSVRPIRFARLSALRCT
ncbi:MAG: hypothetical protein KatS3mg103_1285 [Phycisphaerales bacterium]|nr:MAG: hypothetical protein KatS3mg103_1285 [Phycisphaerales bacterium]